MAGCVPGRVWWWSFICTTLEAILGSAGFVLFSLGELRAEIPGWALPRVEVFWQSPWLGDALAKGSMILHRVI